MPTPFPGMDPYLERRDHWHAGHTRLLVAIADALGPQVWPHYRVDIELRTYIETIASLPGFGMVPEGHVSSSAGPNRRTRRTKPGSVRVRIDPIPAQG